MNRFRSPRMPDLSQRDARLTELMDNPDCDARRLRRTLRRFAVVNAAVAHWGAVYRGYLRPVLARLEADLPRTIRLLDIGCGAGDVLRGVVRRARSDGFAVEALGINPDPRAIDLARAMRPLTGVTFSRCHSRALVAAGERFDIVISNHVLHHLDDHSFADLIADSESLASELTLHSDIARSRGAYAAFAVAAAPLAPGSFVRIDGLRSIRRSYTPAELRARLPAYWSVERPGRFRLLAVARAAPNSHAG